MIETFGLFWLIVSRTVWCPWVYWGWGWRDSMSAREQVHKTYHSADGCGASVGVLAFTSLFSHYNRETNARFGIFLIFFYGQTSPWVNLPHSESLHIFSWIHHYHFFFTALAVSFCILTGRPTTIGRAAPGLGPALGPETGLVAWGWPGMFRRLNLGTTATLTLRLGRAWTEGGPRKAWVYDILINVKLVCDEMAESRLRTCMWRKRQDGAYIELRHKVLQGHNSWQTLQILEVHFRRHWRKIIEINTPRSKKSLYLS